ncbi:pilus assembly protein TadG-related protein [Mesorhizobium sp. ANAO-SY3R2]|uniref:pilus assembly protein TadG-related protein n=1 Tax=Mesorhizobium sp. ANAO-SY3R2 TaxID=3166644 RepID=UPI00366AFDB7
MIRKFLKDKRGNYTILTVFAMVPIMGALALAIDYAEVLRQREAVRNALDAAGMATARRSLEGATNAELETYALDFFNANLGGIKPANAPLKVTLPSNNFGGGNLEMETTLKYQPYFLPVAAALLGKSSKDVELSFVVKSGIRLKNTLEVALVLDNSGSMSEKGSGTGQKRIDLLKNASKQLVETLAAQAAQMKQIEKPVQFGLVPFSASVNIGPQNDNQPWMDTAGLSPIHHENFDWSKMTLANAPLIGNRYAELAGGIWRKRGAGWGDTQDQPLTRFSLYQDITVESDRERVEGSKHYVCYEKRANGTCKRGADEYDYTYTYSQFSSWQGCVEARPAPYNNNDEPASKTNPATLFVPMFAPDEARHLWRLDMNGDGVIDDNKDPDLNNANFGYGNNWWVDWDNSGAVARQKDMRKYFRIKPYGSTSPSGSAGPNSSCSTTPITPLVDVSKADGKQQILKAIDAMTPTGNTNVPEGTAWGWRVVSSGAPFTEGRPDGEKGNDKVVIVLTDGANTYGRTGADPDGAGNKSTYAAYGYTGVGYNGTSTTRMFMDTSSAVSKTSYTTSNYQAAMDEQMQMVCTNAKGQKARKADGSGSDNVIVMTVSLDLSTSQSDEKKAIEELSKCASYSRSTPGKKLYWNATGANLMQVFKEIADELSNLRIVS